VSLQINTYLPAVTHQRGEGRSINATACSPGSCLSLCGQECSLLYSGVDMIS